MTTFYLGTHQPGWLNWAEVPLFVSDRRLKSYVQLPYAVGPWALDSGGFTELQQYGAWTVTAAEYAARVRRYSRTIGRLAWAAPQDWMCEDAVINGGVLNGLTFAGTGLTVREHQWRTIDSVHDLRALLGNEVRIIPVVQGQTPADYARHVDWYRATGIDLYAGWDRHTMHATSGHGTSPDRVEVLWSNRPIGAQRSLWDGEDI